MKVVGAEKKSEVRRLWRNGLLTWAALLILLFSSLGFAYLPLGKITTAAGLAIALAKAAIVMALFMELAKSRPLIWLAALSGIFFATALYSLTLADVLSRAPQGGQ